MLDYIQIAVNAISGFVEQTIGLELSIVASFATLILFIVGLLSGALQVTKFGARLARRIGEKVKRHSAEGLYRSDIFDVSEKIIQVSDVIEVKRRLGSFEFKPIYLRDKKFDYSVQLKEGQTGLLEGSWNHNSSTYSGTAMLSKTGSGLSGYMLGNSRSGQANVLTWKLTKTALKKGDILPSRLVKAVNLLRANKGSQASQIARVVQSHEENPNAVFEFEDLKFRIEAPVCNPELSTFSEELLKQFEGREKGCKSLLDLGCGCGFYAVRAKKRGVNNVVAVDFADVVPVARSNAVQNLGPDHKIDFRIADSDQVFSPLDRRDKFDVILANLPFAPAAGNDGFSHSAYFKAFAASQELLFNFILGAKLHLKPGGAVYFPFGETGNSEQLGRLISVSGLDSEIVTAFGSRFTGSQHQIYRLSRDD